MLNMCYNADVDNVGLLMYIWGYLSTQGYLTASLTCTIISTCSPGALSESEAEMDGEHNSTELPQRMGGTGNTQNDQSAIRYVYILTFSGVSSPCVSRPFPHQYSTLCI